LFFVIFVFSKSLSLGGRRDDRHGGFSDRRGGGGGRGGNPPGRKTEFRCVVENISAATSWQVRPKFSEILAFDLTTNFSCLSTFFSNSKLKFLTLRMNSKNH
jgi:hypothetical protein